MVGSSSAPSHDVNVQNHIEPQRHHTISGPISGRSSTSDGRSNGSHNPVAQTSSSPTKSSSAHSSPKMGKRALSTSTSSPRPRRHAPPPPSGAAMGNGTVGGAHLSRKNKVKSLKDNRYSLQVDPRDFHDHHQPSFGSLTRHSGPAPPTRKESMPESSTATSSATSSGKPPLYPSVSLGSASSLQEAKLAGYSSFVNPHQTGSSSLQPTSAPVRRYSSDASPSTAGMGTSQLMPIQPELRRSSMGEMAAAANNNGVGSSSSSTNQVQHQQPASESRYQRTQSTSSSGSLNSGNVPASNHPRSGSNRSSSSPGSPTKDRSRSTSKERDFHHQASNSGSLGPPPVMKLDLPTSFSQGDGMELVEAVRKKTGVSHRKSLIAINEVLEFVKNRVPMCGEMVDGLMAAVHESQQVVCVCVCGDCLWSFSIVYIYQGQVKI